jgi:cyclophilin family peptidyl-prolyl cis-trans isomerase
MSATPTPTVQGTQAPSQIDLLWDRYRKPFYVIVLLILAALGIDYAIGYLKQRERDTAWSSIASTIGLDKTYGSTDNAAVSLSEALMNIDLGKLKLGLESAPDGFKPYMLFAVARKSVQEKDWDGAESLLQRLEKDYPTHITVKQTPHPVQTQDIVKKDPPPKQAPNQKPEKPEWKPPVAGSQVFQLRAEIASGKGFKTPGQFARVEVPADATKIKYELSGAYGSFVIALMPQAEKHREALLKLAEANHWKDFAIDEIRRPAKTFKRPMELHFGFESTKDDDRTKWTDTKPSEHQVDFEKNTLSHFAGAVSARVEADGKSCADRLWISVDDAPANDGERVVLGYVVEGLDNLKKVCQVSMKAEEEDQGQGKPSETIRITATSVVK